jgi:hypothetical protein
VTAKGAVTRKVTRIGAGVQILENTVLHLLPDNELVIEDDVVIGPGRASFPARSVLDGFPAEIVDTLQGAPERPSWALTRQALGSLVRL